MRYSYQVILAFAVTAFVIVLAACSTAVKTDPSRPTTAILEAEVTDFITNTERRNNSTYYIWVQTDETSVYCTFDKDVFEQARKLRERVVPITIAYAEINRNDPEYNANGTKYGYESCDDYTRNSKYSDLVVYRLLSIHEAGNGEPLGETE